MNIIPGLVSFILHIDTHLNAVIETYGTITYVFLFLIIFIETGFVITPFLPGDSLLFAAGAFAALGSLQITLLWIIVAGAAVLGDTVNYWIGHYIGPKAFTKTSRVLKREYLDKTHAYFEKYGGKTIIIARFVPIVRTFAPFVAGVGAMSYGKFLFYNIIGGLLWVSLFLFGGYFFGNIPAVKHNFTIVIFVIILLSLLPPVIEYVKEKKIRKKMRSPNISVAEEKKIVNG